MGVSQPRLCLQICFITGGSGNRGKLEKDVAAVLESGIRWIQYRNKSTIKRELFFEALRLRSLTNTFNACLIINDYADIALAVDADGVHLGQDDLPLEEARRIMGKRIIGISTHSVQEALSAERGGADYIGFGSIFPTTTKEVGAPKSIGGLKAVVSAVDIPVIAIGGIKPDNVQLVFESDCAGVAASSGILEGDIRSNVQKFLKAVKRDA